MPAKPKSRKKVSDLDPRKEIKGGRHHRRSEGHQRRSNRDRGDDIVSGHPVP